MLQFQPGWLLFAGVLFLLSLACFGTAASGGKGESYGSFTAGVIFNTCAFLIAFAVAISWLPVTVS